MFDFNSKASIRCSDLSKRRARQRRICSTQRNCTRQRTRFICCTCKIPLHCRNDRSINELIGGGEFEYPVLYAFGCKRGDLLRNVGAVSKELLNSGHSVIGAAEGNAGETGEHQTDTNDNGVVNNGNCTRWRRESRDNTGGKRYKYEHKRENAASRTHFHPSISSVCIADGRDPMPRRLRYTRFKNGEDRSPPRREITYW